MDQFKLAEMLKCNYTNRSSKLYSMIQSFKHILGPDFTNSEELIYVKNYYKYFNHQCKIEDVEIYAVLNNKLFCIYYSNEFTGTCIDSYPISDIKFTQLKEKRKYSIKNIDLSIHFSEKLIFNLNNFNDTYDDIGVDELGEVILNIYSKLI